MLTCITCSKQRKEEEEDREEGPRGNGNGNGIPGTNKEAVKSLSTQFKDMALKVSGNSKQSKPNTPGGSFRRGHNRDFDAISEAVSYAYNSPRTGKTDSRFTGPFGAGNRIPTGLESVTGQSGDEVVPVENEDEPKEWIAQVEPGVQVTFLSLPSGGNDLKRIRFSRDLFNKWEAQRWWGENYDRIMELYNVQRFNRQALNTPSRSEDQRDSTYSRLGSVTESPMNKDWGPRNFNRPSNGNNYKNYFPTADPLEQGSGQQYNGGGGSNASSYYAHGGGGGGGGQKGENIPSMDAASRTTTSSRDEASVSISNASDIDCEWIEQDEPGIYITIRQLADGTRELRRVRFSREKFGEVHAKLWWEANRDRIQAQYL